jgi:hypothetical protein
MLTCPAALELLTLLLRSLDTWRRGCHDLPMTTTRPARSLPPMRAEDLLFVLQQANRLIINSPDLPVDLPPHDDMLIACHLLAHPRFIPALHTGFDAADCPDCLDACR